MKKFLVYSLIILVLFGIFSPVSKVYADDPLGTCNYPPGITGPGGVSVSSEEMTQAQCTGAGGTSWMANPFGVCTINGQRNENWQQKNCVENNGVWAGYYNFLTPLPCPTPGSNGCDANGKLVNFDPTQKNNIGAYLNLMLRIFIGICAVLSVVMIVMGGVEYMTSELISSKEAGKERITGAIFGLLLALGAWTLLNQINPDILKSDLSSVADVTVSVELAQNDVPQTPVNGKYGHYDAGSRLVDDFQGNCPSGNLQSCLPTLPSGVQVCASNGQCGAGAQCTTVGQPNCTSTFGLDTSLINALENNCTITNHNTACPITITAGTEFWLHGGTTGNTSHQPGGSTVDISTTSAAVTSYITGGGTIFPAGSVYSNSTTCFYAEPSGATTSTTGDHWHIYPKPSSGSC